MSDSFVLDSSVSLTWFFPAERSPETDSLLQSLGASALGVSLTTAKRWWHYARAWLKVEMRRN